MDYYLKRYQEVMQLVWDFPENNQRPHIISTLTRWCGIGERVLDIGAGSGYYLSTLAPSEVVAIEPNVRLRNRLCRNAKRLDIPLRSMDSITSLDAYDVSLDSFDLVLLIHVLFYLSEAEWRYLLHVVAGRPLYLVHPDPDGAVTVAFEDFIGQSRSRLLVESKRRLLGVPSKRKRTTSHFRLPLSVDDDDLVFLVAHPLLQHGLGEDVLAAASEFVDMHRAFWIRDSWMELPQPQVIERYDAVPALPVLA